MAGMSFDLDAYLRRIGVLPVGGADVATLRRVVLGQAQAIPFENLAAFLDQPVSLRLDDITAKLVEGRRGGWCFEQNLLLRTALLELGYHPVALMARVVWNSPPGAVTPRSHMLMLVEAEGARWLIDVGFGGQTLTDALRFEPGLEQDTPHGRFRICHAGDDLTLEAEVAGEWRTAYRFDLQPQHPVDYEAPNWYLTTHPSSHFRHGLMVARPAPGVRWALAGRQLTAHHADGPSEKRLIADPAELRAVLAEVFDIDAPAELDAAFDRL
jgi:N-hydroxyarylamine O-acetyltransferase